MSKDKDPYQHEYTDNNKHFDMLKARRLDLLCTECIKIYIMKMIVILLSQ